MASPTYISLRASVGLDATDDERLGAFWASVAPRRVELGEPFLRQVEAYAGAASPRMDAEDRRRLREGLESWLDEVMRGRWGRASCERRRRLGHVLAATGVTPEQTSSAMYLLQQKLLAVAHEEVPQSDQPAVVIAVLKATDVERTLLILGQEQAETYAGIQGLRDTLFGRLPLTAMMVDERGQIRSATARAHLAFGIELTHGLPHFREVLPPAVADEVDRQLAAAGNDDPGDEPAESPRYRVTATPIEHPVVRTLVCLEDLEVETERAARQTLDQLGALASAVAHELRNPLAGISATIQLVLGSLPPEDMRRTAIGKVRDQITRLDSMVDDLFNFARPLSPTLRPTDLARVARHTVPLAVGDDDRVALGVRGQGRALADIGLLQLVLSNLVQNAAQAGARRVEVVVEDVAIRVLDDGPGIPPEMRAEVFKPFVTTRTRGSGLGLTNARRAMEAMGGRLELAPSRLGGAGFLLRLAPAPAGV